MIEDPDQCQAEKANGRPCTDVALPGLGVCHAHLDQSDAVEATEGDGDDRPVWERQAEDQLRGGA